ncbi:MAG TPA: XRE family transcriptional regulator [Bryobacteraceae bacterium]|nr:XRE family transcriptional regulator [Bryobacteraceae bacterium]
MRVGTPGFIPERLTEAREARGLAQTRLSELTGIKSQSISHYEQGRQSPSPEALALLCEKLELPERYFLRPMPSNSGDIIFFRALRSPARAARLKAERRLSWLKEITVYLRQWVDLPPARVPSLPVPLDSTEPVAAEIEEITEECRQWFRLGFGPLGDIVLLLENIGSIVSRVSLEPELEGSCSQWDSSVPYVFLSDGESASRIRFDAAHELGHLVMHGRVTPGQARDPEGHRVLEAQADRFARAFLLPKRMFGQEVWAPTIDALLTLKKEWNCPVSEMVTRCGEIGLFDYDQVRRALVNLGRRGWRASEPLENTHEPERPRLLARSIRMLIEEGVKDRHAALTDLSLSAADVEELSGLPRGYFAGCSAQVPASLKLRNA